jgi:hypothetical protein
VAVYLLWTAVIKGALINIIIITLIVLIQYTDIIEFMFFSKVYEKFNYLLVAVAVWSSMNVAGTRLRDIAPHIGQKDDPENWEKVHKDVVNRYAHHGYLCNMERLSF